MPLYANEIKNVKITGCAMKRQWNLHYGNDFGELNCLCTYIQV